MERELSEKTSRYGKMLEQALIVVEVAAQRDSFLEAAANDLRGMAKAYLEDGEHFVEEGDLINALVCFSYAHGFLDAGVRVGLLRADDESLFTI